MAKGKAENKSKRVIMELRASLELKRKANYPKDGYTMISPNRVSNEIHGSLFANVILHLHDQS